MSRVIALGYHGVSDRWPSSLAVGADALRRQVALLLDRGYRPATVSQAAAAGPHERLLVVTFDDALASVHRVGLPVLDALGVVATVYAPTGPILTGRPMAWPEVRRHLATEHAAELDGMSLTAMRELMDRGWEIGSHTRTHPWLPRLDDNALRDELAGSRAELEDALGVPCPSLAYPFGAHDDRVVTAARAARYTSAVTLPRRLPAWPPGPEADDRLRLPRIGVYRADDDHTRFRIKVAAPVRLARRTALWERAAR